MGDESFPSINYVPIHHDDGPGILQSLMALHNFIQTNKEKGQGNQYLAGHPYEGATNSGALDAALKIFGDRTRELEGGKFQAEGQAATSNAASRAQEVGQEGTYQQGMLANSTNETNNRVASMWDKSKQDWQGLSQDQARTDQQGRQFEEGQRGLNIRNYADNETARDNKKTATDTTKSGQIMGLLEHYMQRANSGIPLSDKEQQEYDQVKSAAFGQAGIQAPVTSQGGAQSVDKNAIPLPPRSGQNGASSSGAPASPTRLSSILSEFNKPLPSSSYDPLNRTINSIVNGYREINPDVDSHGNPAGVSKQHLPDISDIPLDLVAYIQKMFARNHPGGVQGNPAAAPVYNSKRKQH